MSPRRWVLIRGLGRHSGHWGRFSDVFTSTFPQDLIEKLDTAGNGTENNRKSFTSIAEYVDDLRQRSIALQQGPIQLLAMSLGGMIAANWAMRFPDEVESLILINTSDRGTSGITDRLQIKNYLRILKLFCIPKDATQRELEILNMTINSPGIDRNLLASKYSNMPMCTRNNFIRQLFAASQFEFPKENPCNKTLLLRSQSDHFVNPICTQRIAQLWNCKMLDEAHGGHDLPTDNPDWIAEQLKLFI